MSNQEKAYEILSYIAQNIISPLAFDIRPASQVWDEMMGEPFYNLCIFVNNTLDK